MKLKELFETKTPINFVKPNDGEEYDELVYQLEQDKQKPFLPKWVRIALQSVANEKLYRLKSRRDGTIMDISPAEQLKIGNTGDKWEDSHWKPESVERVPKMFRRGQTITMPTLLMNKQTQEKWLLGGHHRLTYNAQVLKNTTPCWVIVFNPTQKV